MKRQRAEFRLVCAECPNEVSGAEGDSIKVLEGWAFDGRVWRCPEHGARS